MQFASASFGHNYAIPADYAFCAPDRKTRVKFSQNYNPHFTWSGTPAAAKSLALICHDCDVPSKPDDVNQEGRVIPAALARVDFHHWVLVDIDPKWTIIKAGEFSSGITPRGKPGPDGPRGTRQGLNDYTGWFASDKDMAGNYFGYDGPCPPWNDSIPHHYVFTIYALDVEKCPVNGTFKAQDVLAAMESHILDKASFTGVYSLNPSVKV